MKCSQREHTIKPTMTMQLSSISEYPEGLPSTSNNRYEKRTYHRTKRQVCLIRGQGLRLADIQKARSQLSARLPFDPNLLGSRQCEQYLHPYPWANEQRCGALTRTLDGVLLAFRRPAAHESSMDDWIRRPYLFPTMVFFPKNQP